jgi:hypothetical protein
MVDLENVDWLRDNDSIEVPTDMECARGAFSAEFSGWIEKSGNFDIVVRASG